MHRRGLNSTARGHLCCESFLDTTHSMQGRHICPQPNISFTAAAHAQPAVPPANQPCQVTVDNLAASRPDQLELRAEPSAAGKTSAVGILHLACVPCHVAGAGSVCKTSKAGIVVGLGWLYSCLTASTLSLRLLMERSAENLSCAGGQACHAHALLLCLYKLHHSALTSLSQDPSS